MDPEPLVSQEARDRSTDPTKPSTARVLLTVEEAAARLSFSRTRVYALIKSGDIDSVRVGRLRRIPADAVLHYAARLVAEQSTHPGHAA